MNSVKMRHQKGAALLAAMLTVTLVATLASAAMWQQFRTIEIEAAERARTQNAWVLTGALDWSRLILREDARSGGADDLTEPWAVPLAEARLSTFLAAADQNASTDVGNSGDAASEVFLSGRITDMQGKLNVTNLLEGGKVSLTALRSFGKLFDLLGLPVSELNGLAENLRAAMDTSAENRSANIAPLLPQRLQELSWLGLSNASLDLLEPHITLLPARSAVNLNTASVEVLYAAIGPIDLAMAQKLALHRQTSPYKTLADASRLIPDVTLNAADHATATRFFEVRGRLRTSNGVVEEQSLIQRDGMDVRILRRERMLPALPPVNPTATATTTATAAK